MPSMTKKQLKEALDEQGIEYPEDATNKELEALLAPEGTPVEDAETEEEEDPKTEEEVEKFYEITPYYPFELAYWHMQRYQRKFRKEIVNLSFGEVLDYGAGIGDLCIELAKRGNLSLPSLS